MGNSFNPDEMNLLAKVVDEACLKLGCADARTKEIIADAGPPPCGPGERDFGALLSAALNGEAIPMRRLRGRTFKASRKRM